jgi:hypothetical protein
VRQIERGGFIYTRLKFLALQGASLCGMSKKFGEWFLEEHVTAVLRLIRKEAFADSFQRLYERCQQCVVNDGDCFEGQ